MGRNINFGGLQFGESQIRTIDELRYTDGRVMSLYDYAKGSRKVMGLYCDLSLRSRDLWRLLSKGVLRVKECYVEQSVMCVIYELTDYYKNLNLRGLVPFEELEGCGLDDKLKTW